MTKSTIRCDVIPPPYFFKIAGLTDSVCKCLVARVYHGVPDGPVFQGYVLLSRMEKDTWDFQ